MPVTPRRVLVVVPPLVGHVTPTLGLGRALQQAGHTVAWAGYQALLDPLLGPSATVLPLAHDLSDDAYRALRASGHGLRGAAAFKFLWEELFFPLARMMRPSLDAAVAAWKPDLLVVDQQTFAGALVARQRGLPWVTSAATSANLVDPFDTLPQLRTWYHDGLCALQDDAGLAATPDGLLSPHAVVAWSTLALVGDDQVFPPHWHFVGPAVAPRPGVVPFPWDALQPERRRVLISLGTVSPDVGGRFYGAASEALHALDVQGIVVAPDGMLPDAPAGTIVRPFVPQLDVLWHVDAVVCHAGHNTTVETLARGLPLVVAPIRDDQPVVAAQVVAAGAGVRVRFGRVSGAGLAQAVTTVLDTPSYRQRARHVADSFQAAGGVARAARVVQDVMG